jgi:serine/threonine-protein kinase RsbW
MILGIARPGPRRLTVAVFVGGGMATAPRGSVAEVLYTARFDLANLKEVRREIDGRLRLVGLSHDRTDDFVVAINEVLTNAVEHGGGIGTVELSQADGHFRCVVHDRGRGIPHDVECNRRPDATTERGRGLWLAFALCADLVIDSSLGGTTVTLAINVAAPAADLDRQSSARAPRRSAGCVS